jgi:hypothetical protein
MVYIGRTTDPICKPRSSEVLTCSTWNDIARKKQANHAPASCPLVDTTHPENRRLKGSCVEKTMLLLLVSVVVLLVSFEEVPPPDMFIVIRSTAHFRRTPKTGLRPRPSPELLEMNPPLFSQPCITRLMGKFMMGKWGLSDQHSLYQLRWARDNLLWSWSPFKHEQPGSRSTTSVLKYKVEKCSTSSLIVYGEKSPKGDTYSKIWRIVFFSRDKSPN